MTLFKKTLLTLACAAAAAGTAAAAEVQVYGLIDVSMALVSADADDGHGSDTTLSMENAREFGSRFGIKGSEDLGNGYKVAFTLESGFAADDGSLDQDGRLFGRESHVDLETPYGTVAFGRQNVFGSTLGANGLFRAIDPLFANYTEAFGSGQASASSWTRVDNAVSYVSPTFAGVTGYAMYSFKNDSLKDGDEGRGGSADRYASLALRWQAGSLETVLVADTTMYGTYRPQQNLDDGYTVTAGGNYTFDNGVKVLAWYQYFADQYLADPRGGVSAPGLNAHGTSYGFLSGWGASLGVNVPAFGGVAKAQIAYRDADNQNNDQFKRWFAAAGYDYSLSKRTALYVMGGYSHEKVESSKADFEPEGWELVSGIVHRF